LNSDNLFNFFSGKFDREKFFQFVREITKNFQDTEERLYPIDNEYYKVEPVKQFEDQDGLNFQVILVKTDKPSKMERKKR